MDYETFKREILNLTGIDLSSYKERQMKRRIDTLIERKSFNGYAPYLHFLESDDEGLRQFVNYLTINVSEFYRNPTLWETFEKDIIPELIHRFGTNLKIWSAACSTGDEAYSIVMALSRCIPLEQIRVIATDIDDQVILKAKEGIYDKMSISSVPQDLKDKYFVQIDGGRKYRISDDIKRCVEFRKHNLLCDSYGSGYHLIVCRNVMIYFTEEAKNSIYKKFNEALVNDGVLFVGNSEQVVQYSEFGYRMDKLFFYSKDKKQSAFAK